MDGGFGWIWGGVPLRKGVLGMSGGRAKAGVGVGVWVGVIAILRCGEREGLPRLRYCYVMCEENEMRLR